MVRLGLPMDFQNISITGVWKGEDVPRSWFVLESGMELYQPVIFTTGMTLYVLGSNPKGELQLLRRDLTPGKDTWFSHGYKIKCRMIPVPDVSPMEVISRLVVHFVQGGQLYLGYVNDKFRLMEISLKNGNSRMIYGYPIEDFMEALQIEKKLYVLETPEKMSVLDLTSWRWVVVTLKKTLEMMPEWSVAFGDSLMFYSNAKIYALDRHTWKFTVIMTRNPPPLGLRSVQVMGRAAFAMHNSGRLWTLDLDRFDWYLVHTDGIRPLLIQDFSTVIFGDYLISAGFEEYQNPLSNLIYGGKCEIRALNLGRTPRDMYFTDVKFVVRGERFEAHRIVLCRNRYFRRMFFDRPLVTEFELDFDPESFKCFLEHMYSSLDYDQIKNYSGLLEFAEVVGEFSLTQKLIVRLFDFRRVCA